VKYTTEMIIGHHGIKLKALEK